MLDVPVQYAPSAACRLSDIRLLGHDHIPPGRLRTLVDTIGYVSESLDLRPNCVHHTETMHISRHGLMQWETVYAINQNILRFFSHQDRLLKFFAYFNPIFSDPLVETVTSSTALQ